MKKFFYFSLACSWFLLLLIFPGYSWGEDKMDRSKDEKASKKSISETVKGKFRKEMEEVKKGTQEGKREMVESGKEISDKARSQLKETGKAFKEAGKESKENVGEAWKDLKKEFKNKCILLISGKHREVLPMFRFYSEIRRVPHVGREPVLLHTKTIL